MPVRGSWNGLRIVRPLLGVRRGRLRDYLGERGLPYLTDATNYRPANMRSRIRHELLPLLEALRPGAVPAVARCALSLQVPDAPLGVSETLYFGLREIRLEDPLAFLACFMMGEEKLRALTADVPLNTDSRPIIEFSRTTAPVVSTEKVWLAPGA